MGDVSDDPYKVASEGLRKSEPCKGRPENSPSLPRVSPRYDGEEARAQGKEVGKWGRGVFFGDIDS